MDLNHYLSFFRAKERRGSKPRCHLITHDSSDSRAIVASRLTDLVGSGVVVNPDDFWMPLGFDITEEAELDKADMLLDKDKRLKLRDWWLKIQKGTQRTPNWDIASTCTINGNKGILLIEAKAHVNEIAHEAGPKKLKNDATDNSKINHDHIGTCIKEASIALESATGLKWNLSHDKCYQMSNRFAWSWKLTQLGVPVALVYLGFIDAQEMEDLSPLFTDYESWKNTVLEHSKGVVPKEVWGKEWMLNGQMFLPLIRTSNQPLEV